MDSSEEKSLKKVRLLDHQLDGFSLVHRKKNPLEKYRFNGKRFSLLAFQSATATSVVVDQRGNVEKSSFGFSSLGRQQLSLYLRRDNHLKIGIETDLKTTKSPFNHAKVLLYISNDFPTMLIAKQEDTSKI